MSQLFPTLYVSFDGFQRRQLKQELHHQFNSSVLNKMGFKLKLSPRSVVDFGTPDPQQAKTQCQQSSLFVVLLEEAAGHGSRQKMLLSEVAAAALAEGTELLMVSDSQQPNLPSALTRVAEHALETIETIEPQSLAAGLIAKMEQRLCQHQTPVSLALLPDDYSIDDYQPQQVATAPALLQQLLSSDLAQSFASPEQANLAQHQQWLLENLRLQNPQGATQSAQHCLSLFDSDLMANYWRCRLLVDNVSKERESIELIQRAELIQRHLTEEPTPHAQLLAQSYYYQAQGYIGLNKLEQAQLALEQGLAHQSSPALLHQQISCSMLQLAQQQTPTARKEPALLRCKRSLLQLLQKTVIGYQLSTQQLLLKNPREKLEMVLLGVKQTVVSTMRQLKQQEQTLKQLCGEWELIISPTNESDPTAELLQKPIWNLIQVGQQSIARQFTLVQLLSQHVAQHHIKASSLEQQTLALNQQQQALSDSLQQIQQRYQDTIKARQLSGWGLLITALLAPALYWLPVSQTVLLGLLGTNLLALLILALLFIQQRRAIAQTATDCRLLDSDHALQGDELPEPRAQEGWFDRIAVRRDKLRDRYFLLQEQVAQHNTLLKKKITQLAQAQAHFAKYSLAPFEGIFHHSPLTEEEPKIELVRNESAQLAMPPEIYQRVDEPLAAPSHLLTQPESNAWYGYFELTPNSRHCRALSVLEDATNSEPALEDLLIPELRSESSSWQLDDKLLITEGEACEQQQLIDLHQGTPSESESNKAPRIQLTDTLSDSENSNAPRIQLTDALSDSEDPKPPRIQLKDALSESEDPKPPRIQLKDALSNKEPTAEPANATLATSSSTPLPKPTLIKLHRNDREQ